MCLFGTSSHSSKLLKVPRIYNALITSDENLLPSQAYPALTPVVHEIRYPLSGYLTTGLYRTVVIPNQVQFNDGQIFTNAAKEDFYHYNYVQTNKPFKVDLQKIPEVQPPYDKRPALFRPAVHQMLRKNESPKDPVAFLYSTESSNTLTSFNSNKKVHFESSSAQKDAGFSKELGLLKPEKNHYGITKPDTQPYSNSDFESSFDLTDNSESSKQSDLSPDKEEKHSETVFDDFGILIKNNRPNDPNIADVPPPPLPIGSGKSNQKKPEEYPPPPVGYIL